MLPVSLFSNLTLVTLATSYNPFPNYPFTGTLRPLYPLSPKRAIPDHIPRPDYAVTGTIRFLWYTHCSMSILIRFLSPGKSLCEAREGNFTRILNAEEIQKMRTACRVIIRHILNVASAYVGSSSPEKFSILLPHMFVLESLRTS